MNNDDKWVCIKLTGCGLGYIIGQPSGDYKITNAAYVSDSDISVKDAIDGLFYRVEFFKIPHKAWVGSDETYGNTAR